MKEFWILLTRLPHYCYMIGVVLKLQKLLDSCKVVKLCENTYLRMKFFRFRALVDLTKPLQRVLCISTLYGTTHAGLAKYERIPNFCFNCGMIGHNFRNCYTLPEEEMDVKTMNYRAWMGGVDNVSSNQIFLKTLMLDKKNTDGLSVDVSEKEMMIMGGSNVLQAVRSPEEVSKEDISHVVVVSKVTRRALVPLRSDLHIR